MARRTKGELYELRVARLLFSEGWMVRRAVDLRNHFGKDFTITDVDVLAWRFLPALHIEMLVGECKTTEAKNAPGTADRLLWSAGLRQLLGADRSLLVMTRRTSPELRRMAAALTTEVLDADDLARREAAAGIGASTPWGAFAPDRLELEQEAGKRARGDDELRRLWWFVRAEFWFMEPVAAVKRAIAGLRTLSRRWHERMLEEQAGPVTWLAWETSMCLTLALVRLAGEALHTPQQQFARTFAERLSEGAASFDALRAISRDVDRYLLAVLQQAGIPPAQATEALGVLDPKPPGYTESLVELLERLAEEPTLAAGLPRLLEWRIAEAQRDRPLADPPGVPIAHDAARLLRLIAAFLRGQIEVPEHFVVPLVAERLLPLTADDAPQPVIAAVETELRPGDAADHSASGSELSIAVRNTSNSARRVVTADARAERHGELPGRTPIVVRAGQQLALEFAMPADGLFDSERIDIELTDDDGRRHAFAVRHVGDGRFETA